ncbi:MAG: FAD-binding protein [Neomegalonema sp.]|nr:FAD-binding protein [Neomegalonema sp.]
MAVLVLVEHDGAALNEATAKAVAAAKLMGGDIHLLCVGDGCGAIAEAAAKLDGVAKVLHADDAAYANRLAEPIAALIASQAGGYDHLVAPATASGKNIMARLAGLLDVMLISDISGVEGPDVFERPIYAGNALATVKSSDAKKVVTVRTASFQAVGADGSAPVEALSATAETGLSEFVGEEKSEADRPQLTSAKIIVSGGRALGSEENFALIEKLADRLGAAVGASRAAVDSGYAPNDYQVGQTGKVVAPDLYIAVGISGAIQHLAGMKDSRVIVAINKDEEAPIFQVADYGLVADLFTALPELEEELTKAGVGG